MTATTILDMYVELYVRNLLLIFSLYSECIVVLSYVSIRSKDGRI